MAEILPLFVGPRTVGFQFAKNFDGPRFSSSFFSILEILTQHPQKKSQIHHRTGTSWWVFLTSPHPPQKTQPEREPFEPFEPFEAAPGIYLGNWTSQPPTVSHLQCRASASRMVPSQMMVSWVAHVPAIRRILVRWRVKSGGFSW